MRPSLFNYALAHTFGISAAIGAICGVAWLFATLINPQALITDLPVALWGMFATVPAVCLGWFFGALIIWPITFRIAKALQGAPFRVGDRVWILVGKHKGTLTRVYEVWGERGQVRVELGADDKNAVTDVFCLVAICRDRIAG